MILDTNAISAWAEGNDDVIRTLPDTHEIALPVIAIGEFLWGLRKSRRRADLEAWLAEAIDCSRVLDITLATCDAYATIRQLNERQGRPIPPNDTWIAALALEHNLAVLSTDRHFDAVDGIQRVSWR